VANSYPSPIVLPDAVILGTGRVLTGGPTSAQRLAEVANYLIGNMARGTVGQAWPDSHFYHVSDSLLECLRYKIAVPPGATTATVRVFAGATTSTGVVRVVSTQGGDTLDLDIDSAADIYVSGTIDIGEDDGMEEIVVSLKGGDGATDRITLLSFGIVPDPIASPLPATGAIGNAIPLGVSRFAVDESAPAWLYQALIDDLVAARDDYPRTVAIWSAGADGMTGPAVVHQMLPQLFRYLADGHMGLGDELSEDVTIHARLTEQAESRAVHIAQAPDLGRRIGLQGNGVATASAGAGAATDWKIGTAPVQHVVGGQVPYEMLDVEVDPTKGDKPVIRSLTVVAVAVADA